MTTLQKADFRRHLKNRKLAPVYLLHGPETFLQGLAVKTISKIAITEPGFRDFNENTISLNDVEVREALQAAEQLPIGDKRRVVIITDLYMSTNHLITSLKGNADEVIARYLEDPCQSTVVVFLAEEFDKRLKTSKLFEKLAIAVEFKALDHGEAVSWVRDKLRKAGLEAEQRTIDALVSLAGVDAGKLLVEVEKLAIAALPEKKISRELVERLVKHSRVLSNFDLTDYLVAGRREDALAAMKKILDDGAEPVMLLGLLSYNFRQLFIAKELMERGLERDAVISEMRL
ncbi:MAG: DNA polymerase III subunit delta, partial [Acidobacteriota bacterium]|nr:DNA polymerase III subunit delta [Acidobacteriota bacterium]